MRKDHWLQRITQVANTRGVVAPGTREGPRKGYTVHTGMQYRLTERNNSHGIANAIAVSII